ncbi:beta-lactamase family protein [Hazenella sp. IB182357]|uniref:Beta-lactamase family protein n=1 Tax=Polycladospora coralii TaxID=2771432 RepID=A0A926N4S3_9BACL|nr:serine hydrolase domain-containing protein [Polycladospora coralii]MBD1370864.1 beta-lactamase family protein [Polycladospora coralii]MBS7529803.1 beta-lactamase family protein [Polycladospora coralii]
MLIISKQLDMIMRPFTHPMTSIVEKKYRLNNRTTTEFTKKGVSHPQKFSGVILIGKLGSGGKILSLNQYGMRNYKASIPLSTNTKFRIASNTKLFTALAIMILQQEKKLHVNDRVNLYTPHLLPKSLYSSQVTIHQLLTNTSGLTANPSYKSIHSLGFSAKPGTRYIYSNSNYMILGKIIEKVAGYSFESYIKMRILQPLQLHETGFSNTMQGISRKTEEYVQFSNILVPIDESRFHLQAAGGMYSTVTDLFKFNLNWTKLVSPDTIYMMFQKNKTSLNSSKRYYYGYGRVIANNQTYWRHIGEMGGCYCVNSVFLKRRISLIYFSNIRPMLAKQFPLTLFYHIKKHLIDYL